MDPTAAWIDVLSQAVTGERVGALNYEALARISDDPIERAEAIEHGQREAAHARMFQRLAEAMGRETRDDLDAPYWSRIHAAFLRCAESGDRIGCLLIQEVMLESFAVASYSRIASSAPPALAPTFAAVAAEEQEHVAHAIALLRTARERDAEEFDRRAEALHFEVMTTLAEMVAREDPHGHCGLCQGTCVKESLPLIGLCTTDLRGASLRQYLQTLDRIGVPGERSLQWVARLPV